MKTKQELLAEYDALEDGIERAEAAEKLEAMLDGMSDDELRNMSDEDADSMMALMVAAGML